MKKSLTASIILLLCVVYNLSGQTNTFATRNLSNTYIAAQYFSAGPVVDVRAFGALGNGSHDDTSAISAAIASISNGGRIYASAGTYKITSSLSINKDSLTIFGDGNRATIFAFYPASPGLKLFNIYCASSCGAGGNPYIEDVHFENFEVRLGSTTNQAIAFFERNGTNISWYNVFIESWNDVSALSIGLETQGREYLQFNHLRINADIPWSLERNPDYPTQVEDCDFCTVTNSALAATVVGGGGSTSQPVIRIADGAALSRDLFENIDLAFGSYGIYWADTTAVATSFNITLHNIAWEQATAPTGYMLYFNHTGSSWINNLEMETLSGESTNSLYLRRIRGATLRDSTLGGTVSLDVADNVYIQFLGVNTILGTDNSTILANIPSCGGAFNMRGMTRTVTNSDTQVWGAIVVHTSGVLTVQAYCDGTNWTVAAK